MGTCGRTSPWMTSPTQKSVWLKVKKSHLWALLRGSNFPAHILRLSPPLLFFPPHFLSTISSAHALFPFEVCCSLMILMTVVLEMNPNKSTQDLSMKLLFRCNLCLIGHARTSDCPASDLWGGPVPVRLLLPVPSKELEV